MNRFITAGFGIFSLVLGALLVVPLLVDVNNWKPEIEEAASTALGRKLRIEGPISLSILPYPGINLTSVRISNVEWAKKEEVLTLDSINFSVSLLKLFSKTLEFSSLTLIKPTVSLETNAKGENNWTFPGFQSENKVSKTPNKDIAIGGWSISEAIPKIIIRDGELSLLRDNMLYRLASFDAQLQTESYKGPYNLKGNGSFADQPFAFSIKMGKFHKKKPSSIDLNFDIADQRIEIIGVYLNKEQEFKGQFASKLMPSVFLGDISAIDGYVTATADLVATPKYTHLTKMMISGNEFKCMGHFLFDWFKKPNYQFSMEGFPGQTSISLKGPLSDWKTISGQMEFDAEDFSAFMNWLNPDWTVFSDLSKFTVRSDLTYKDGQARLDRLDLSTAEKKITGHIILRPPVVELALNTPEFSDWLTLLKPHAEIREMGTASLKGRVMISENIVLKAKLSLTKEGAQTGTKAARTKKTHSVDMDLSSPDAEELMKNVIEELEKDHIMPPEIESQ